MNVSTELMYTLTLCNNNTTIQTDFAARALKAVEEKKRYNSSWVPPPAIRLNVFSVEQKLHWEIDLPWPLKISKDKWFSGSLSLCPPLYHSLHYVPPRENKCLWLIYIYLLLANLSCYSVNQLMSS